jgi:hypothetical protein
MEVADTEAVKKRSSKPFIKATSKLNPLTGIVSNAASKFSADNWGAATQSYFKSIDDMNPGSLKEVVQLATPFMSPLKSRRQGQGSSQGPQDNMRACLIDN